MSAHNARSSSSEWFQVEMALNEIRGWKGISRDLAPAGGSSAKSVVAGAVRDSVDRRPQLRDRGRTDRGRNITQRIVVKVVDADSIFADHRGHVVRRNVAERVAQREASDRRQGGVVRIDERALRMRIVGPPHQL